MIDELYQAHRVAVLRVCSRILRNTDDAADASQEVFLIAIESLDPVAKPAAARAWLLTVARNHCLDLLRRRKRLGKALVTLGPDDGRATDMESAVADRDFVDVVFKQLSQRERQALWQSAVESRPLADIATGLRLSYMAAAQVLHRARQHAVKAAARVAVVFGVFQLGRQRAAGAGTLTAGQRLAAAVAVPLIVVSLNASTPSPQAASASAAPAVVSHAGGTSVRVAKPSNELVPSPVGGGPIGGAAAPLAGSTTSTLNSATDAVRQLLRPLPSVPPELARTPLVPSVAPLASPPPIP